MRLVAPGSNPNTQQITRMVPSTSVRLLLFLNLILTTLPTAGRSLQGQCNGHFSNHSATMVKGPFVRRWQRHIQTWQELTSWNGTNDHGNSQKCSFLSVHTRFPARLWVKSWGTAKFTRCHLGSPVSTQPVAFSLA